MGHCIRIFAGSPEVLGAYCRVLPLAQLFALTSQATVLVLPLDDDLHDALHHVYPAGTWDEEAVRLSSGDMAFAAAASAAGPLAYLETNYFGGMGFQSAALWNGGRLVIRPSKLNVALDGPVAWSERPINRVLAAMGVVRVEARDEFDSFGLGFYRSNESIWSMARAAKAGT